MKLLILSLSILLIGFTAKAQSYLGTDSIVDEDESARFNKPQIGVFGSLGSESYNLSGGPGTASTNGTSTANYGARGSWHSKSANWGLAASYEIFTMSDAAPAGVTPTTINVRRQQTDFVFTSRLFKDFSGWVAPLELGIGYMFGQRTADGSVPYMFVTNEQTSGPMLRAHYLHKFYGPFHYDVNIDAAFYNGFKETGGNSGNYNMGYLVDGKFAFIYPIASFIDVSLGVQVQYEAVQFSGPGGRNLTDASEAATKMLVPLGLTIYF